MGYGVLLKWGMECYFSIIESNTMMVFEVLLKWGMIYIVLLYIDNSNTMMYYFF